MNLIRDFRASRELLVNLTLREVRGKYKRTSLGQLWSLVNPLAAMLIYTLVFGFLLRIQPEKGDPSGLDVFALWLLCGLLPWTFVNAAVNAGMNSLVNDANLIKKVWFPREVLVVSAVMAGLVTHGVEMLVLSVVLLFFGAFVVPWLPLVVVTMVLLGAFATGLALLLSVANVYFRDTQHFVAIGLQMWFYLTPILYPLTYVSDKAAELGSGDLLLTVYRLNPMERFTSVFRSLLYDNTWPQWGDLAFCAVAAAVFLTLGYVVFKRHEPRIAEEL